MNLFHIQATIKQWRERHPYFVFLALMIIQMALFYFLYFTPSLQETIFSHLVNFYASISSGVLNVFRFGTSVNGDTIYSPQFSIGIKKGCDALEPMAMVAAGIIAFPSPARKKLTGLLTGLSFLFLLNIVRIVTLYVTGIYSPSLFEAMHIDVWQIIFILCGLGFWFVWVRKVVRKKKDV